MKQSTSIIFFTIVLFTDKINAVEFNVFGNVKDRNEFACNTQAILQCIVNPNKNPVLWRVGNPITPSTSVAAQCSGNSCSISAAVSSIYNFSYDENSGDTNMTIKHVTLAEDGKQYKCDDGFTSLILDSVVQVPPVKETTQISNKIVAEEPENTIITCSTGCVANRTAQFVTFKWYKIENGTVSVYKDATPPSSSDDSPCQINSDCITNGSVVLSNSFTITEDRAAPEVYFEVHILLDGDFLFSVNTTATFQPKSVITSLPPSTTPNNASDGCNNTCDCCKCEIKELCIVFAVAWASAITVTFVGGCILKYSLNTADLRECIFKLGSLPWIFLLVVVLLYKGDKKKGLIPLVISLALDVVFIVVDRYYVCSCENVCEIELLDHLWASPIYLMVCVVLSVLKYIILEKCCESDSTVSNSSLDLNQSDVGDRHEQRGARPLPRISSVSSRLGNEKEHAHSLNHVNLMHRSPLPPISTRGKS